MIRFGRVRVDRFGPPDGDFVRRGSVEFLANATPPPDFRVLNQDAALAGIDLKYESADHHIRRILVRSVSISIGDANSDPDGVRRGIAFVQVEIQLADQNPFDDPFDGAVDIFWIAHTNEAPV